jgi:hypothetical protein
MEWRVGEAAGVDTVSGESWANIRQESDGVRAPAIKRKGTARARSIGAPAPASFGIPMCALHRSIAYLVYDAVDVCCKVISTNDDGGGGVMDGGGGEPDRASWRTEVTPLSHGYRGPSERYKKSISANATLRDSIQDLKQKRGSHEGRRRKG